MPLKYKVSGIQVIKDTMQKQKYHPTRKASTDCSMHGIPDGSMPGLSDGSMPALSDGSMPCPSYGSADRGWNVFYSNSNKVEYARNSSKTSKL